METGAQLTGRLARPRATPLQLAEGSRRAALAAKRSQRAPHGRGGQARRRNPAPGRGPSERLMAVGGRHAVGTPPPGAARCWHHSNRRTNAQSLPDYASILEVLINLALGRAVRVGESFGKHPKVTAGQPKNLSTNCPRVGVRSKQPVRRTAPCRVRELLPRAR